MQYKDVKTYKEWLEVLQNTKGRHVKGMDILVKIFDETVDGPWEYGGSYLNRDEYYSRKYAENRLRDHMMRETDNWAPCHRMFPLPNGKYLVAAFVKKGSKKEAALVKYGFEIVIDFEEKKAKVS